MNALPKQPVPPVSRIRRLCTRRPPSSDLEDAGRGVKLGRGTQGNPKATRVGVAFLRARVLDALVVRPAITATHGGLAVDEHARVLRADGSPVPGLFAAGADAGGIYGRGYAGGLALAMGFGIQAARAAGYGAR